MMRSIITLTLILSFCFLPIFAANSSFLANDSRSVLFVTWLESRGLLSGELQFVRDNGKPVPSAESFRLLFRGERSGNSIRINFQQNIFFTNSIGGTLNGNTLTLNFPIDTGGFAPVRLLPSTITQFNLALDRLRSDIGRRAQEAQKRIAREEQELKIQQGNEAVAEQLRKLVKLKTDLPVLKEKVTERVKSLFTEIQNYQTLVERYELDAKNFSDCENSYEIKENRSYALADQEAYRLGDSEAYQVEIAIETFNDEFRGFKDIPSDLQIVWNDLLRFVALPYGARTQSRYTSSQIRGFLTEAKMLVQEGIGFSQKARADLKQLQQNVYQLANRVNQAAKKIC
jgi:hypothetical protein